MTDTWLQSVKPDATVKDYFSKDKIRRGVSFLLRITPHGTKSWQILYRQNGKQVRFTLGSYPDLGLAGARDEALRVVSNKLSKGKDPQKEKKEIKQAATFEKLAQDYLENYAKVFKKSWKKDEQYIRLELVPRFGNRKYYAIDRFDLNEMGQEIARSGRKVAANRAMEHMRGIYSWALSQRAYQQLKTNPFQKLKLPSPKVRRQRTLTKEEIRTAWRGYSMLNPPFDSYFHILMLTGARRSEICNLKWTDISEEWAKIRDPKNKKDYYIFLTETTKQELARVKGDGDLIFSKDGANIYNMVPGRHKTMLQTTNMDHFVIHDLRRVVSSGMAEAGVHPYVINECRNKGRGDLREAYEKYDYRKEMASAWKAWEWALLDIILQAGHPALRG